MKAFLYAAGFGTRLKPLTERVPKPLVLCKGIPLICYSLSLLKEAGISDLIINLHYKSEDIISFFKAHNNFGFNVNWSFEEEILGTGGGVMKCRKDLEGSTFIVINSDIISDVKLNLLLEEVRATGKTTLLLSDSPSESATVSLQGDSIVDFKGALNSGVRALYDYTGIACVTPDIFPHLQEEESSIVYTGFTGLISSGKGVRASVSHSLWYDVGTIERLHKAEEVLNGTSLPYLRAEKLFKYHS